MTLLASIDPTVLSRISHPGSDRNLFLRHMVLRLTGGVELNECIRQASHIPAVDDFDEMKAAEDYCQAFQWLGIPCTPAVVRGSSDYASQLEFLERLLRQAQATDALCTTTHTTHTTPHTDPPATSNSTSHLPTSQNNHNTTTTTSSSRSSYTAMDSVSRSTDSRRSVGSTGGSMDFGSRVGGGGGVSSVQLQLLDTLCERASHLFLPPPALFPQDVASTLQPDSLRPEDIPSRLSQLERQLAGLNAAQPSGDNDQADDGGRDQDRASALQKLLHSFTTFMEAVNTFMRCSQQEVLILTQSSTPRPFLNLGPLSAALVAHHSRLEAVVTSINTLMQQHKACERASPQGVQLQESLQRLSQSAQAAVDQAATTFKLKAIKQL